MFARIGTWEGSPEALECWMAGARERVKPNVRGQPGLEAAYWLVDREARKGLTITIWESEEAMRASEQLREESQARTADASGAQVTTERYEVFEHV